MNIPYFSKRREHPIEDIEALLVLAALGAGLFIVTPFYNPELSLVHNITNQDISVMLYGIVLILLGFSGIYGILWKRIVIRRAVQFLLFFSDMYFALIRAMLHGWSNLVWVSILTNSLIAGIVFLWLRLSNES